MTVASLSFEMFPPASPDGYPAFLEGLSRLRAFDPAFLSITYGANGSGRDRSETLVNHLLESPAGDKLAAHVTAVGNAPSALEELLRHWKSRGLERLVALRGDSCEDGTAPGSRVCSIDLVERAARIGYRDISVACYPEGHPLSVSPRSEMDHLKRKLNAGARRAISQFFFDAEKFLRYRDACHRAGITAPIVPGLLVPSAYGQARAFAIKCGASIPRWMDARFAGLETDPVASRYVAVATTVTLAERLYREGCGHIHIYSLNRFSEAEAIARCLGFSASHRVAPVSSQRKVA